MLEVIENWDRALFLLMNGAHTDLLDQLMWHVSGKLQWIPLYLFLLYFLIKNFGLETWKILLGIIVVILLTDQTSVHLFKNVFERYRPCHNLDISHLVHTVNGKCGGKFGFVSSHAANTFGLAIYMGLIFIQVNKKWIFWLIFWALIVSYSRIYLGVHYPLDILGGAMIGSIIGFLVYKLVNKLSPIKR